jgi:hypothetical protein
MGKIVKQLSKHEANGEGFLDSVYHSVLYIHLVTELGDCVCVRVCIILCVIMYSKLPQSVSF